MRTIRLSDFHAVKLMVLLTEAEMAIADGSMPPEDRRDHITTADARALIETVAHQTGLPLPPPL